MLRLIAAVLLVPALAGAQAVASDPEGTASEPSSTGITLGSGLTENRPGLTAVTTPAGAELKLKYGVDAEKVLPTPKLDAALTEALPQTPAAEPTDFKAKMMKDSFLQSYQKDGNLGANAANFAEGAMKIAADPKAYFVDGSGNKIPQDQAFNLAGVAGFCNDTMCVPANQGLMTSFQLLKGGDASTPDTPLTGPAGKYPTYNACIAAGECMGPPSPEPDPAVSKECPGPGGVPCSPERIAELSAQKNFCPAPTEGGKPLTSLGAAFNLDSPEVPIAEKEQAIRESLQASAAETEKGTVSQPETPSFGNGTGGGRTAEAEGQVSAPMGKAMTLTDPGDQDRYTKSVLATVEGAAAFNPDDVLPEGSRVMDAQKFIEAQLGGSDTQGLAAGDSAIRQARTLKDDGHVAVKIGARDDNIEGLTETAGRVTSGNGLSPRVACVKEKPGMLGSTEVSPDKDGTCSPVPLN
ncbi:MAG: hypothetical protein WC969_09825 [Elusimicrobiota bacterium]|jgi:hypothetical protein